MYLQLRNKLGEVEKVLQKHTKDEDSGAPELPRFLEHGGFHPARRRHHFSAGVEAGMETCCAEGDG